MNITYELTQPVTKDFLRALEEIKKTMYNDYLSEYAKVVRELLEKEFVFDIKSPYHAEMVDMISGDDLHVAKYAHEYAYTYMKNLDVVVNEITFPLHTPFIDTYVDVIGAWFLNVWALLRAYPNQITFTESDRTLLGNYLDVICLRLLTIRIGHGEEESI